MNIPLSVLVVEDSADDAELLVRELRRGDYDVEFERVDSSTAMSAALDRKPCDLVICDYSMPYFSGADALRLLRARNSEIPFIFLSGTIGEDTAVAALKEGAQDYIMKDNLKRLLPAVRRELREVETRKERSRMERHLQQLQRFEAIGRLAGSIAHDFNNALGVILGWAQLGRSELPQNSPTYKKLEMICQQARNSADLCRQLLAFARRQVLQPSNLSLSDLVTQTKALLDSLIGGEIDFTVKLSPNLSTVRADRSQIEQVLMNLCLNARDAMPHGGRLSIQSLNVELSEELCRRYSDSKPGRYVLLEVSDTGTGMDADTLEHIFEPFFTTKEVGRGTGLGLATVYGVVQQHEGFVHVESEPGLGTTFRVYLPAASGVPDEQTVAPAEQDRGGVETILIADDNEELRELAREALETQGYRVIVASNGEEAVDLMKTSLNQVALVLLDVTMPVLNGRDAYSQMCTMVPNLPVIFSSGYPAETASLQAKSSKWVAFLQKPYDLAVLYRAVRSLLDIKSVSAQ